MNNFTTRFRELRKLAGFTQNELANKLGVVKSTISMYETGKRQPDFEKLEEISDFFNVNMDYLLGRSNIKSVLNTAASSSNKTNEIKCVCIPVLDRVAAGTSINMVTDIIDQEQITEEMAATGEYFALKIHGDSMEPKMSDDDIVIVRQQDDAETGDIVIAAINGDDATCKRLRKYTDGIMLLSTNAAYEPMTFTNKDIEELPVKILGKVVELRAKF